MTNYVALGEYTAYTQQARDAAGRRYAQMTHLASVLNQLAHQSDTAFESTQLHNVVDEIIASEREMRAALDKANQSAALCRKPALELSSLLAF